MPNQTLYDNFSQVRQYIDQEKPDLSSYVTKSELSGCSYATTSDLSAYLPLTGGILTGDLTINNTYILTIGSQRAWKVFEDGSGGGAYIALQANVDSKNFYIRDNAGNNVRQIYESSANPAKSFVKNFTPNTYTNSILPNSNNDYTLGNSSTFFSNVYSKNINVDSSIKLWQASTNEMDINLSNTTYYFFNNERFAPSTAANHNKLDLGKSDRSWKTTYTQSLYLNGNDLASTINTTYSLGKIHVGTATHNRTTYTTTCTVDSFETDANGNPLPGTMIAVKLTSVTGTNPATLYQVHFVVNDKENDRIYSNISSANNGFGNGRNWYRDMNDGTNRYWYWVFDGTYWVWHGISDERDTTYSAMSDAEASAGTSTSARLIKPVTLATYYTAKSCFSYDSSTGTLTITI